MLRGAARRGPPVQPRLPVYLRADRRRPHERPRLPGDDADARRAREVEDVEGVAGHLGRKAAAPVPVLVSGGNACSLRRGAASVAGLGSGHCTFATCRLPCFWVCVPLCLTAANGPLHLFDRLVSRHRGDAEQVQARVIGRLQGAAVWRACLSGRRACAHAAAAERAAAKQPLGRAARPRRQPGRRDRPQGRRGHAQAHASVRFAHQNDCKGVIVPGIAVQPNRYAARCVLRWRRRGRARSGAGAAGAPARTRLAAARCARWAVERRSGRPAATHRAREAGRRVFAGWPRICHRAAARGSPRSPREGCKLERLVLRPTYANKAFQSRNRSHRPVSV